jgi:hypothetical protein
MLVPMLLVPTAHAQAGEPVTPSAPSVAPRDDADDLAVWIEPIGTGIGAGAGIFYLSAGANVVLGEHVDLVPEAAFTVGDWYGGGGTQTGTWLGLGLSFHTGSEPFEGFFLQPKLRARIFDTSLRSSSSGALSGSVTAGVDAELGLGLDFGIQWMLPEVPIYVAVMLGIHGGICIHCHDEGLIWFGTSALDGDGSGSGRSTRGVLGVNVNLLRTGLTF